MAVSIPSRHTDADAGTAALAQLRAEHAVLYEHTNAIDEVAVPAVSKSTLINAAVLSGEAHDRLLTKSGARDHRRRRIVSLAPSTMCG